MNKYIVTIQQSIRVCTEIEADSEEEAKEKAMEWYSKTPTDELDLEWQYDDRAIECEEI